MKSVDVSFGMSVEVLVHLLVNGDTIASEELVGAEILRGLMESV